ncbi:MAG: nitroreductase family protein, partial [Bacilli bacterium]
WEFYVITEESYLKSLRKASRFANYNAPGMIVVAGNLKRSLPLGMASYWIQDCSSAIENILLGATSLGLATCWCGLYPQERPQERVRTILSLPKHIIPLAIIHVGYPAEEKEPHEGVDNKRIHFIKEGVPFVESD